MNCGARMRWAVLLIGRNSVRPWMTPRSSECCRFNLQLLRAGLEAACPIQAAVETLPRPDHVIIDEDFHDRRHRHGQEHPDQAEELGADEQHNDNYGGMEVYLVADELRHQDLALEEVEQREEEE